MNDTPKTKTALLLGLMLLMVPIALTALPEASATPLVQVSTNGAFSMIKCHWDIQNIQNGTVECS